ncbi:MAG: hypothetical protein RL141_12 [Candidatus Parcubacteria bacterium]|jgi:hypothetical protein
MDEMGSIKEAMKRAGLDRTPQQVLAAYHWWDFIRVPWFRIVAWRGEKVWRELVVPPESKMVPKSYLAFFPFALIGWTIAVAIFVANFGVSFGEGGSADIRILVGILLAVSVGMGIWSCARKEWRENVNVTENDVEKGREERIRFYAPVIIQHLFRWLYAPLMPFIRLFDWYAFWITLKSRSEAKTLLPSSQYVMSHYRRGLDVVRRRFLGDGAPLLREIASAQAEIDGLQVQAAQANIYLREARSAEDSSWIGAAQTLIQTIELEQEPIRERLQCIRQILAHVEACFAEYDRKIEGISSRLATRDLSENVSMGMARRIMLVENMDETMRRCVEELQDQLSRLNAILADAKLPENPTDGDMRDYLVTLERAEQAVAALSTAPASFEGESVH